MKTQSDPELIKALARAHRWTRLLESERYRALRELAAAEGGGLDLRRADTFDYAAGAGHR